MYLAHYINQDLIGISRDLAWLNFCLRTSSLRAPSFPSGTIFIAPIITTYHLFKVSSSSHWKESAKQSLTLIESDDAIAIRIKVSLYPLYFAAVEVLIVWWVVSVVGSLTPHFFIGGRFFLCPEILKHDFQCYAIEVKLPLFETQLFSFRIIQEQHSPANRSGADIVRLLRNSTVLRNNTIHIHSTLDRYKMILGE